MKRISILGSTGSIGTSCLEILAAHPDRYQLLGLAAGENVALMAEQVRATRPRVVSMASRRAAEQLHERLRKLDIAPLPEIGCGTEGMVRVATIPEADLVLSAAVGVAGLPATYAALRAGKQIALANKEVLVAAGELMTRAASEHGIELLPVDSEHNGVHQCLRAGRRSEVRRLVLTASGGPFLDTPPAQMERASVEDALRHPTWRMGSRITIDSATLMNKGFEVIEARWLFGFEPRQIKVKVHPQSTVHSLVEFVDGSVIAQLSVTDMKVPIHYALSFPERIASNHHGFDWEALTTLEFRDPDLTKFPCLRLAYQAMEQGAGYPCALNAADEVAVGAFLARQIPFGAIPRIVEDVLQAVAPVSFRSVDEVLEFDQECRARAKESLPRYRC